MIKTGIIVGYSKTHRNKLMKCLQLNRPIDPNIQVLKTSGLISKHSLDIQNSLKESLINISFIHKIYLIIKYERLDLMKINLQALIPYFQDYRQHICLIISDFKESLKKTQNIQTLKTQLVIQNNLSELAIQIIGGEREQDILEHNGHQYLGQDIINFFRSSMCHTDSFKLDHMKMGLEIILDPIILQQLHQITNTQYQDSEQQFFDNQDIPQSGVSQQPNQNKEKSDQIQRKVIKGTNMENQIKEESSEERNNLRQRINRKQEIEIKQEKKPIQEEGQEVRNDDNQSMSWFEYFIQWFKKLFK